ncbi:hypothetical protein OSTOST_19975 [Ostertagia ostertagi]
MSHVRCIDLLVTLFPWIEKNVTTKDARNTAIDQLITWREYEIQVAAYNHRGLGVFSKSIDVTTAEGVPTQAPKNVIANVLNSTAVEITFTAPDQQRIPGVNLGYKVALRWNFGKVRLNIAISIVKC